MTLNDLSKVALQIAEKEIQELQDKNRLSKMVANCKESVDEELIQALAEIDANGDGEIDGDEMIAFAKTRVWNSIRVVMLVLQ